MRTKIKYFDDRKVVEMRILRKEYSNCFSKFQSYFYKYFISFFSKTD